MADAVSLRTRVFLQSAGRSTRDVGEGVPWPLVSIRPPIYGFASTTKRHSFVPPRNVCLLLHPLYVSGAVLSGAPLLLKCVPNSAPRPLQWVKRERPSLPLVHL